MLTPWGSTYLPRRRTSPSFSPGGGCRSPRTPPPASEIFKKQRQRQQHQQQQQQQQQQTVAQTVWCSGPGGCARARGAKGGTADGTCDLSTAAEEAHNPDL